MNDFENLVYKMRSLQKLFIKERSGHVLEDVKRLENEVDNCLDNILKRDSEIEDAKRQPRTTLTI